MKFTYLLGAGASAQAMPTVKEIGNAIDYTDSFFKTIISSVDRDFPNKYKELYKKHSSKIHSIINILEALSYLNFNHLSIDTFFKKLYLTKNDREIFLGFSEKEYNINKEEFLGVYNLVLLMCEFSIIQLPQQNSIKKYSLDPRYDNFFATIMQEKNGSIFLPENINIVSWNYDIQIERSIANFFIDKSWENIFRILNNSRDGNFLQENNFFKLNGTALKYNPNSKCKFNRLNLSDLKIETNYVELIDSFLEQYTGPGINIENGICFQWTKETNSLRNRCIESVQDTNILVVIGYSFPTFNRETDRQIIRSMRNLEKVYIQCPKEDYDGIKMRFRALIDNEYSLDQNSVWNYKEEVSTSPWRTTNRAKLFDIENIYDTAQFFIPPEY